MTEPLSAEWVTSLVEASAECEGSGSAEVELAIGKTKQARFSIEGGRVTGPVDDEAEVGVRVPLTGAQLTALIDGSESLAQAFMRGDIKPEGSTGHLLPLVELFEDVSFRQRFAALV
ncbi:MAG: SCP2 sterol-binding domain-containing protein [Actinomycetota bacterium]